MAAAITAETAPSLRLANRIYGDSKPGLGDRIKAGIAMAVGVSTTAFLGSTIGLVATGVVAAGAVAAAPVAAAAVGLSLLAGAVMVAKGAANAASNYLSHDFAERTKGISDAVASRAKAVRAPKAGS